MTVLTVATCQFPVSADIEANAGWMARQLREAVRQGARVAHFPEGALSGYAGTDFGTFTAYDWDALDRATDGIRELANELGIWVAAGSAHRAVRQTVPRRHRPGPLQPRRPLHHLGHRRHPVRGAG